MEMYYFTNTFSCNALYNTSVPARGSSNYSPPLLPPYTVRRQLQAFIPPRRRRLRKSRIRRDYYPDRHTSTDWSAKVPPISPGRRSSPCLKPKKRSSLPRSLLPLYWPSPGGVPVQFPPRICKHSWNPAVPWLRWATFFFLRCCRYSFFP